MPLLNDPSHTQITHSLRTRVPEILKLNTADEPRAIVVVTAHWSEVRKVGISSAERHGLLYDYQGFPAETYKLKYEAPGSGEVAKKVGEVLRGAGLGVEMDEERGMLSKHVLLLSLLHQRHCCFGCSDWGWRSWCPC